ncbi:FecR domain-containing protein [Delftia deserti]|uniref:FecR domain-containing protein n=1 Tax=Delftia deserti TaxID=1651218 RepID=A0ABW5EME8_9BURK
MPGGNGVMETPLQARVLDEAAEWLMRLHDSGATEADRAACERWRQADPQHALAWERAERLLGKLGGLPAALAMPALDRPRSHRAQRRAAVARLAALLAVAPAGWLAWQAWYAADQRGWGADLRTATGERRTEHLADGSRLLLDTASAVDIRFDGALRLLTLRQGAISIETAADTATPHRPFVVDTAHGRLRALGTRFTVRQEGGRADGGPVRLTVTEGAVEVTLRGAASPALGVQAGQQTVLRAGEVTSPQTLQPEATAWTHGMLMADAMPLAAFCAELSRYRPGLLQCAPEVRALRVSGSFPLGDTDRTLTMLASTYPVDVQTRMRGYWITVVARN